MEEIKATTLSVGILDKARRLWMAQSGLRSRRDRCKRFTYGDQWGDLVYDLVVDDEVTAAQKSINRGRQPMTNNLIRRLVRCIVGRFRMQLDESPRPEGLLGSLAQANDLDEIDSRSLEEFLISGCAVQKVCRENRPYGNGVWVDWVSPDSFFTSDMADPRGRDAELVGMLHEMGLTEVMMRFGRGDRRRIDTIAEIYRTAAADEVPIHGPAAGGVQFNRARPGRCRVIEVWTLEASQSLMCHDPETGTVSRLGLDKGGEVEQENNRRRSQGRPEMRTRHEVTVKWHARWMAPDGSVLGEDEAVRHPFSVKFYPLIDGEVHSLVEDAIDQQIYINRLITLVDHVIGSSAKGALLFPVSQLVPGTNWEDVARRWASPDGVIPIQGKAGVPEPRQVAGNGSDGGAKELLQLQMRMFEDVSGVSNALMGRSSSGCNAGVDRYEAEVKNATISILDLLRTFDHFRLTRDRLMLAMADGDGHCDGKKW